MQTSTRFSTHLFSFSAHRRLLIASVSSFWCSLPIAASAATINPTFYGKAFVTLDSIDQEGAGLVLQNKAAAPKDNWELNSNASRLGVKGETELEIEGLSAIYQAEYEINVDDGSGGDSSFSQRNTFAGLKGHWGQVIAGKFDTPFKTAEGKVDQFNDLIPDIDLFIGGQNRLVNSVQYSSPKLGLFQLTADFIPAEDVDIDRDGVKDTGVADTVSASVVTQWCDHWYAALAYDGEQAARRSVDGIVRGNALRAVVVFNSSAWEAGVLLQQTQDTTPSSDLKDDSYLLSGAWTLNKTKLKAQAGYTKGDVSEEEGTVGTIGVDYSLAKKTLVTGYASYLALNKSELEDSVFGVGLLHSF
jgi:predicted porin